MFGRSIVLAAGIMILPSAVWAQESSGVSPVVHPDNSPMASTAAASAILNRVVTLHLDHVVLGNALKTLADSAHLLLSYSETAVPVGRVVSLVADRITVRDAFDVLLAETGFTINISRTGHVRIWPAGAGTRPPAQQGTAMITGLVTDSGTGTIITQAIVHIDGAQLTVRTNATGHYTLSGLAPAEYRVNVRHVGYLSKTHTITLADGDNKTLNFALNEPATTLNEVVTTAIGDARRYQVGNVISTINVNSIVPNAPVTSVTDLITGRAPGVDIAPARDAQVTLLQESPDRLLRTLADVTESARPVSPVLELPFHHEVRPENIVPQRLRASLIAAHERGPTDFADVLLTPGVGPRTVFSLSLVAEVLHGTPSRFSDPARYSLAHGGKDGHPYPVPLHVYDETIRVLKDAVARAKLGTDDRLSALRRLDAQARQIERTQTTDPMTQADIAQFIAGERDRSAAWGGRTVKGWVRPGF